MNQAVAVDSGKGLSPAWQLAAGAMCISLAAPLVKGTTVDPSIAAVFRVLFGAVGLGLLMLLRPRWRAGWRRGWAGSALVALFFTMDLWLWHRSIHWVGPGLATLLANFQVFLLPVAGRWLHGEKPATSFYIGLALAAVGLWLLFGLNWQTFSGINRWGILYGLLTAVAYTAYLLTLRRIQTTKPAAEAGAVSVNAVLHPVARLFQVCLWCTLMLVITTWQEASDYSGIQLQDWLLLIALGVICQVMGWLFITRALPAVPAAVAGLLLLLQPSLSLTWDHFFFGLVLNGWQLSGVVLTLAGIYYGSVRRRRRS